MFKHALPLAAFATLLFYSAFFAFYTPVFDTNDDIGMMMLTAGPWEHSPPAATLCMSNIIIGVVLSSLYSLMPDFSWYTWYLIGTIYASHVAIFYSLLKLRPQATTFLLWVVIFIFTMKYLLILQFTIACGFAATAGYLLLYARGNDRGAGIAGVALLILSSIIRFKMFIVVTALHLVTVITIWMFSKKPFPISATKPVVIAITIAIALYGADAAYYKLDPAWATYSEHNSLRVHFVDYIPGSMSGDQLRQALIAAGWSRNDYMMISEWFFMGDTFSADKLKAFLDTLPTIKSNIDFDKTVKSLWIIFSHQYSPYFLIAVLGLALIAGARLNSFITLSLTALALVAIFSVFIFAFKDPPTRVTWPLLGYLLIASIIIPLAQKTEARPDSGEKRVNFINFSRATKTIGWVIMIAYSCFLFPQYIKMHAESSARHKHNNEALVRLVNDMERLSAGPHISWGPGFPYEWANPFDGYATLKRANIIQLNLWQRSPLMADSMERLGISDIYRHIAENGTYVWVQMVPDGRSTSYYPLLFVRFMQEHYGLRIRTETIGLTNRYGVFRFKISN